MLRTGLLFAGLAAGALAWLLWSSGSPELGPAPETSPAAVNPTAPVSSEPLDRPDATTAIRRDHRDGALWADLLTTPPGEPRSAEAADPRGVVLRGRLTVRQQPWVHPANVEVRVTRSWLDSVLPTATEPGQQAPLRDEPRTRTDEQGRFAFRLLPAEDEMFFLIGHDTEWMDFQKIARLPRGGGELDLGDVWLDQRGSIVGRLDVRAGGATVRVVDDPLLDGNGGFEDVLGARLAAAELLRAPGTMHGGPLPDWVVRRDRFLPFPRAVVADDGTFRVDGIRPGNHDVLVSASYGMAKSAGVLVAPGRTTDIGTLRWRSGEALLAMFVDENGRAWVGAEVAVLQDDVGLGAPAKRTDARGQVLLGMLERRRSSLVVALPGGAPWQVVPWDQSGSHGIFVVRGPREFEVRLTDTRGTAVAGGKVRCYTPVQRFRREDRPLPAAWQPKESTPGVHTGRASGPMVVLATAPGRAPAFATMAGPGKLTLQLLDAGQMTVRTVTTTGEPVADAAIRAQVHSHPDQRFPGAQWDALADDRALLGDTNERGELLVTVWATFFSFQARHPDFAGSIGPRVLGAPGTVHTIVMRGGGDIVGTLTAEHRPAARGLRVRARQRPPAGHELEHSGWLDDRVAVTGHGGAFAFRGLTAGNWELVPEMPPIPGTDGADTPRFDAPPRLVQIDVGQELHLQLTLDPGQFTPATISGVVTQNGGACAGALVRLRAIESKDMQTRNQLRAELRESGHAELLAQYGPVETNPWLARCTTDTFGDFRFRDLQEGHEYELRVDVPCGGRMQFVERRIVRGPSLRQPLHIDVALATAAAHLTFSTSTNAFANRMVRLRQVVGKHQDGACYELLTDGLGNLLLADLPTGSWTVEPMHGGICKPAEFELAVGSAPLLAIEVTSEFVTPRQPPSPDARTARRR